MLAAAMCFLCHQNIESRIDELLRKMTTTEKTEILSGTNGFYTKPIERVGIRQFKMSDGPAGVRTWGKATAFPAPIDMAATWDRGLLGQLGEAYGREARARSVDFLLAPGVNITRVPQNGRNFEYYGEDPFLAGQCAAHFIHGVQSQGVIATVKHFAANNQEFDRTGTSSDVGERTLREIYLPAFETAVKEGGVWAVMCSYNLLNGTYASENDWLLNQVLKKEWGFKGLVMSDWGATHSALGAANHGLDLEMPGGEWFTAGQLGPLVADGSVSPATIDDKVRRILRATMSIGAFDRPISPVIEPKPDPRSAAIALQAAREGIVLLKNEGRLLPLNPARIHRIAVIGPNADPAVVGGGGSSATTPFESISPLDAIRRRLGPRVAVDYVSGEAPAVAEMAAKSTFVGPIKTEIYANRTLSGSPTVTREERRIDDDWPGRPGDGVEHKDFSIRWTAQIIPSASANYEFAARGDDGYRVFLDGKPVIDEWRDQAAFESRTTVPLKAGRTYTLRIEYYQANGDAEMRFGWRKAESDPYAKAVAAATGADAAIVCIGLDPRIEGEGIDHPFTLPKGQEGLAQAVLAANPRTIVVLNGGGAVDMTRWVDQAPALVMAWYPGQNGNQAVAEILFGDIAPSGKLPISLPRRWEDAPGYGNYPGQDHHVAYKEGLFVGYRAYDQKGHVEPLFPFGFGLSTTTFRLAHPQVEAGERGHATVRLDITNTGKIAGDEVVQLYVAPRYARVSRPAKELKGFERVHLEPGEAKQIVFRLDPRSFSYWDVSAHAWRLDSGRYDLLIGESSRDIRLELPFEIK